MQKAPLERQKDGSSGKLVLSCSICGAPTEVFCDIESVPVCCNILWPTREEALSSEHANIHLAFCQACGYIYNAAFDPSRIKYDSNYDNSLHFSERFQEYAQELAAHLVKRYSLFGKTVIEIGCGSAGFLHLLCAHGRNRGIGFDPSFVQRRADLKAGESIEIIADLYSESYVDLPFDLLCSRHMLEHVANPRNIVCMVRRAIEKNPHAAVYFEVPNVLYTLRQNGVWDLIYEHCSYFAVQSLRRLFADGGFHVREVRESFGGQYLGLEAVVSDIGGNGYEPGLGNPAVLAADVVAFSTGRTRLINRWKLQFERISESGKCMIAWGAGSKGTIFLNTLRGHGVVDYVVDINPNKQGKFVPGTAQQIVAPETLKELKPDVLILMNPIYLGEVERMVSTLGLAPQILTL